MAILVVGAIYRFLEVRNLGFNFYRCVNDEEFEAVRAMIRRSARILRLIRFNVFT